MQMQSRNEVRGNDEISKKEIADLQENPEYQRYKRTQEQNRLKSSAFSSLESQDPVISADATNSVM